jgi:hypothetical protein
LEKASKCIELDDKGFQEKEVWMERAWLEECSSAKYGSGKAWR